MPESGALVEKGSRYTEEDKAMLAAVELELLNRVIPEYRAAAGPRSDRDLDVPLLPSRSCRSLRHGCLSANASGFADAPCSDSCTRKTHSSS